ncbi:CPBP family intramembrane metalloprotease [Microbacterium oryzae]|uniref:CPBP family intramembrane metalloprotease n=1 Tax=Microbacterium oryzae TaxID=743009 RepID=A0A6I6DQU2_9MICO|nr:CPBP family intramembrane glutamic endopeptidase [Microbacterium oryzae]QGU26446.1 CPBP family intramembrane metalloprotease [Microbacterium oryzae]
MTENASRKPTLPAPPLERVPWRAVAVYAAAAVALAWLVALPLWLGDRAASPLFTPIASLMMFTPLVATLAVVFGLRVPRTDRLRFLGIWPLRPAGRTIWFAVAAVFVPPVLVIVAALLAGALGLVELDLVGFSGFAETVAASLAASGVDPDLVPVQALVIGQLAAIPLGALVNSFLAFGEEIGWRGWLLPALRPLGVWPALILSGALWGLWHAPLILLGYDFGRTDVTGVLLMIAGCIAWGVLFGWARLRTGSLWPAVIGHGALNAGGAAVLLFAAAGADVDLALVGPLGVVSWIVLAVVVAVLALCGQFRRNVLGPR